MLAGERFLFSSSSSFGGAADGAAISCRGHSVKLAKVSDEVRIRSQTGVFQDLLDCQKRVSQKLCRPAQSDLFQVLRRRRSRFLFEEMAKARWREIDQQCERSKIPRCRWFGSYFCDDEFYSSIHL